MSTPPIHINRKDNRTRCVIRLKPRSRTKTMLTISNYAVNILFNNV